VAIADKNTPTKAITWKDIKATSIMANGKFDLTSIARTVNNDSQIIFSTATKAEAEAIAKTIADRGNIPNALWYSLPAKSANISKPVITYSHDKTAVVSKAKIAFAESGLEWAYTNSQTWTPVQNKTIELLCKPWSQCIQVRKAMTATTGISAARNITIKATSPDIIKLNTKRNLNTTESITANMFALSANRLYVVGRVPIEIKTVSKDGVVK
jgi:hypothetical protein